MFLLGGLKMVKVPSFLLRKLYVKKSLKNTEDGFEFSIKNVLADATLVKLADFKVDGKPYTNVTLVVGDKEIPASEISASNPLPFPVKTTITVKVKGEQLQSGQHKIEIVGGSKEYGELKITLKDTI